MRAIWVTHNYPRFAGDVAGAFLHPLAVALRHRGVEVSVVAPSDEGSGGADELDGVPIERVRYGTAADERLAYRGTMAEALRTPAGFLAFNRLRRALRSAAQRLAALHPAGTVVHAHWWIPAGLSAPTGFPLVLTCHGTDVRLLERRALVAWLARPVFRRARVVTTVSNSLAAVIERETGVVVAPDAVQPMPVTATDRPWSDRTGGIVVVGRLTAQKRIALAIEGYAAARRQGLTEHLTIVGDGPERDRLEEQTSALNLADVIRFVGAIAPADVPVVFASARALLMPAQGEGFGLVAAEAFMQGVSVIACSDGGGLLDVVPGTGAGRIAPPAAEAIGTALLDVLRDDHAPIAARREGGRWRDALAPEFVAERCLTWYERALDA